MATGQYFGVWIPEWYFRRLIAFMESVSQSRGSGSGGWVRKGWNNDHVMSRDGHVISHDRHVAKVCLKGMSRDYALNNAYSFAC